MNTQMKLFSVAVLAVLCLFTSCKKDGETNDGEVANSYTYQNGGNPQTVKITKVAYTWESDDEVVLLFRTEDEEEGIKVRIVYSGENLSLPEGTFNGNEAITGYFGGAILYYNHGEDESYANGSGAKQIAITKDGENYKISFQFTSGVGTVKGNYTGAVNLEM